MMLCSAAISSESCTTLAATPSMVLYLLGLARLQLLNRVVDDHLLGVDDALLRRDLVRELHDLGSNSVDGPLCFHHLRGARVFGYHLVQDEIVDFLSIRSLGVDDAL